VVLRGAQEMAHIRQLHQYQEGLVRGLLNLRRHMSVLVLADPLLVHTHVRQEPVMPALVLQAIHQYCVPPVDQMVTHGVQTEVFIRQPHPSQEMLVLGLLNLLQQRQDMRRVAAARRSVRTMDPINKFIRIFKIVKQN